MLTDLLGNLLRGMSMGAADIVPGVSGGTVALVLGIYERLIGSIRAGSRGLGLLARADFAGFRRWMAAVEWTLILPLGVGILAAVLLLAGIIEQLLHDEPEVMAGAFMGLVAGSVVVAWRLLRVPTTQHAIVITAVGLVTFVLLGLRGGTTEESVSQAADPALWTFFVAGAIAICAMILPGISGSFLLVLMGMYTPLLAAVTGREIVTLLVFMAGAVLGLALFSQALHVALRRYHDMVMAALIGLMAGSIRILWPWPAGVASADLGAPDGDLVMPLLAAAVGFAVVVAVARYAQAIDRSHGHPGAAGPEEVVRARPQVDRQP